MSLKPIDLQAVFARMGDLSKEQALAKEHSALQQSQAAKKQIDQEIEEDHKVSQTPNEREVKTINEDGSNKQENPQQKKTGGRNPQSRKKRGLSFQIPEIGKHIDLIG